MEPARFRLPAEWEPQTCLLLAWPCADSDWDPVLERIRAEYVDLITTVARHQPVGLLLQPEITAMPEELEHSVNVAGVCARYNDTWCRDYGPITLVADDGRRRALDFHFNGWGGRFEAGLDNAVNGALAGQSAFSTIDFQTSAFELEGGAIDCNGDGIVLINRHCFRARHPDLDPATVADELKSQLNVHTVAEIDIAPLVGDDTDGHIDTLARFVDTQTIAWQRLRDVSADAEFERQLRALKTPAGKAFNLVALPAPDDIDPSQPASYANFIVINGAIAIPRYGSRRDDEAREILAARFPNRRAEAINARVLISQGGGPHCASMQIPAAST